MMYIPSTYTATFNTGMDLGLFSKAVVTFAQADGVILNIDAPPFSSGDQSFSVTLTQEQTKMFKPGTIKMQIAALTPTNERWNSVEFEDTAKASLYTEVLVND